MMRTAVDCLEPDDRRRADRNKQPREVWPASPARAGVNSAWVDWRWLDAKQEAQ